MAIVFLVAMMLLAIAIVFCVSADIEPAVFGVIVMIALSLVFSGIGVYMVRYEILGNYEAFHDATLKAYTYTIDESENIRINYSSAQTVIERLLDTGGLTYLELGKIVSDRILELREKVEDYNMTIATFNRMNKNWLLGLVYPEIPERLKLIVLE